MLIYIVDLFRWHRSLRSFSPRRANCQASKFVAKHGSSYYKQLLENNKQYIVDPPTVEKCQELSKKLFYTRLARQEH